MKDANFTEAMRANGVSRIERYEPSKELPHEWFAVELEDRPLLPGTGKTVAEAFEDAVKNSRRKAA